MLFNKNFKTTESEFHADLPKMVDITMGLFGGIAVLAASALISFWEPDKPDWTWRLIALFLLWAVAVWVRIIYKFKRGKGEHQENNGLLNVLLFSAIAAFVVAAVTALSANLFDPVKLGVRIGLFAAWAALTWISLYSYKRKSVR